MAAKFFSGFETHQKRGQFRKPVSATVKISHSTFGDVTATTRDISDTGLFAELPERLRLPIGAHIKLQFLDSARPEIAFNMKVIRENNKGIGLTFVDFEVNGQRYQMDDLRQHWSPNT